MNHCLAVACYLMLVRMALLSMLYTRTDDDRTFMIVSVCDGKPSCHMPWSTHLCVVLYIIY